MNNFRYCEIYDKKEISELTQGLDFRLPEYRREVFLRFYEFHLKYRSHPGAVYYVIPYLIKKYNLTKEQQYWLAFLNGCTQNICTTWFIFLNFPNFNGLNIEDIEYWHKENWKLLQYDIDKRYAKGHLVEQIFNYKKNLGELTQEEFFEFSLCSFTDKYKNFWRVWDIVIKNFYLFGRLSTFSYLEYLKIIGLNIDCPDLFLEDLSGSKSHRNGIIKVCGRDDLDWCKDNPTLVKHNGWVVANAIVEGNSILEEAKLRFKDKEFLNDVNYFTLESTLCCYKSWFRHNRRYPNVYNDIFYNRIKKVESLNIPDVDFSIFWTCRKDNLPTYLRLEDNKNDPGLVPIKQNWFRETGEVIMMDKEWDCFKNNFNNKYYDKF